MFIVVYVLLILEMIITNYASSFLSLIHVTALFVGI